MVKLLMVLICCAYQFKSCHCLKLCIKGTITFKLLSNPVELLGPFLASSCIYLLCKYSFVMYLLCEMKNTEWSHVVCRKFPSVIVLILSSESHWLCSLAKQVLKIGSVAFSVYFSDFLAILFPEYLGNGSLNLICESRNKQSPTFYFLQSY